MMILGTGIDIIDCKRIRKINKNKRFKTKIFTEKEIKKCLKTKNENNCFAKKYAAKEAFSKAVGTGFSGGLTHNEVEILNTQSGKPEIKVYGKSLKILFKKFKTRKFNIFLSISDEESYAIAQVLITK